ncbi:glycosyltransferase family 2 protein [Winogradskyella jejuensis]|uniref:Glycosyl transferase family 2 n=1 Tax=Winogradskyella jejuensis TaxID=1089305 RepID=A0A1M5SK41_9FLAO|nr:glycosyltransferase family A protein [Winogradskyella jejuensis]SHH38962.1 Glycosyl transferase family 2 [Winogradskyella jejuensis]
MSKVSVIIPTYNNPKQLERSVDSALTQTYRDIEVVVVNDGSTVDYTAVKHKFKNTTSVIFIDKENEGPGLARQLGLDKSSGKYINYLDAGDELLPNKIEQQVKIFEANPDVIMTYGLSMIDGNSNKLHRPKLNRETVDDLLKNVLEVRKWHTSSPLWHYKKGKYWSRLFNGEDVLHDFTVAIENRGNVHFENKIMVNLVFDNPDGGLSNASELSKNHKRFVKDCLELNLSMQSKLKQAGLINEVKYAEPLAERLFHAAMRVNLTGYKNESLILLKVAEKTSKSIIKRFELLILRLIISLPFNNRRPLFQLMYKIRRKLLSSSIHQYRYI